MQQSTKTLRFSLLCAAVLVCGAQTASAAPLTSVASAASDAGSDIAGTSTVRNNETPTNVAKNFSGAIFSYSDDQQPFTADYIRSTPEQPSLALLGAGVLCVAGLGRRLFL